MTTAVRVTVAAALAALLATPSHLLADDTKDESKPEERQAIEDVARDLNVPFDGFWLEAEPEIMQARVEKRTKNASDADAEVVKMQLGYDLGDITWHRIDSSGPREQTDAQVLSILGVQGLDD